MATTNFNWTENTGADFEVEANTTYAQIEASLSSSLSVTIDSSAASTLTTTQYRQNAVFVIVEDGGDPPAGAITITVPTTKVGVFTVRNDTTQEVTVTISGQPKTAPTIAAGFSAALDTDGTDIMRPT